MATVEEIWRAKRSEGPATILAIGTANPIHCVDQNTYADYYFRITNSEHKIELKEKFKLLCEKSMIRKRHMHLTEEILKKGPNLCSYKSPSLSDRQDIAAVEVPKLGKEAAEKAIAEWGQPKSKITHLVFSTTAGLDMPGADCRLTKLLGLRPSVKRFMMYHQGCFAGSALLRMAKDLAENNVGARVLVVCSELVNIMSFREPSDPNFDNMVTEASFGDGASAAVVGSGPFEGLERPIFQLISTMQYLIPDSDKAINGSLHDVGASFYISKDVPNLISKNIRKCLDEAFDPLGISDWNSLFWIAHPGGPAILDEIELELGLRPEKLRSARHVLSDYGNMLSACVLFVLDEMRKDSAKRRMRSTGEGLDWGVLFGFGPGMTIETVVLRSVYTLMPKSKI